MRAVWLIIAAAGLLAVPTPVRAGVYSSDFFEPRPEPTLNLEQFRQIFTDLFAASQPVKTSELRSHYFQKSLALERRDPADLTLDDRINLSYYYLRLGEPEKAVKVLTAAEAEGRTHFQFLANLATAHHRAGRLERAVALQQQVLDHFPAVWAGYRPQQLYWLRKCEESYFTLLKLRLQEAAQPKLASESVDALFPRVRFVDAQGNYSAFGIAPAQHARLPGDAALIVQQLLLWDPGDPRLYWLLAELQNANGNTVLAYNLMDQLVYGRNYGPKELHEHRKALLAALELWRKGTTDMSLLSFYWAMQPRVGTLAPGAAALALETSAATYLESIRLSEDPPRPSNPDTPATTAKNQDAAWLPDWRTVTVSFLAGAAFAFLMGLQVQELRRRRRRAEPALPRTEPSPHDPDHAEQAAGPG